MRSIFFYGHDSNITLMMRMTTVAAVYVVEKYFQVFFHLHRQVPAPLEKEMRGVDYADKN